MTTPAELRALADRVCAEEPSDELSSAVTRALPDQVWAKVRAPLHKLDDAAAMMPAGWRLRIYVGVEEVSIFAWNEETHTSIEASAPKEKPARTAAALRVMAAMMEDGNV